jgi:hypothetical protein
MIVFERRRKPVEEATETSMNPGLKGRDLRDAFAADVHQVMLVANAFPTWLWTSAFPERTRSRGSWIRWNCGACHSDLHLLELPAGARSFTLPFTLGHENAGWVEKMGPGAAGFTLG